MSTDNGNNEDDNADNAQDDMLFTNDHGNNDIYVVARNNSSGNF